MQNSLSWISVVILSVLCSCSCPKTSESFVKASDIDSLGRYVFTLDMEDSLSRYDIHFYTRLDVDDRTFGAMGDIPVRVFLVSPDGQEYTETVYISKRMFVESSFRTRDCDVPYRKDVVPVISGDWKLFLLVSPDAAPGLRGMGVRMEHK